MRQRLPRPRSSEGADLNGARRVSFRSTWRYTFAPHLHTYTNMFCFYSSLLLLLLLLFLQPSHSYYYYQRHSHRLLYSYLLVVLLRQSSNHHLLHFIFWFWVSSLLFSNLLGVELILFSKLLVCAFHVDMDKCAIAPYSAPIFTCMCVSVRLGQKARPN